MSKKVDELAKRFREAKTKKTQERAFITLWRCIQEETAKEMESELRAERPDGELMKLMLD